MQATSGVACSAAVVAFGAAMPPWSFPEEPVPATGAVVDVLRGAA